MQRALTREAEQDGSADRDAQQRRAWKRAADDDLDVACRVPVVQARIAGRTENPASGVGPAAPRAGASWTRLHSSPSPPAIPWHGYSRTATAIAGRQKSGMNGARRGGPPNPAQGSIRVSGELAAGKISTEEGEAERCLA